MGWEKIEWSTVENRFTEKIKCTKVRGLAHTIWNTMVHLKFRCFGDNMGETVIIFVPFFRYFVCSMNFYVFADPWLEHSIYAERPWEIWNKLHYLLSLVDFLGTDVKAMWKVI